MQNTYTSLFNSMEREISAPRMISHSPARSHKHPLQKLGPLSAGSKSKIQTAFTLGRWEGGQGNTRDFVLAGTFRNASAGMDSELFRNATQVHTIHIPKSKLSVLFEGNSKCLIHMAEFASAYSFIFQASRKFKVLTFEHLNGPKTHKKHRFHSQAFVLNRKSSFFVTC